MIIKLSYGYVNVSVNERVSEFGMSLLRAVLRGMLNKTHARSSPSSGTVLQIA